jgi:hypothetical protein
MRMELPRSTGLPTRFGIIATIVAAVLVVVAALVLFLPVVECPSCEIDHLVREGEDGYSPPRRYWFGRGCDSCWRGRISVFNRYLNPNSLFYGARVTSE